MSTLINKYTFLVFTLFQYFIMSTLLVIGKYILIAAKLAPPHTTHTTTLHTHNTDINNFHKLFTRIWPVLIKCIKMHTKYLSIQIKFCKHVKKNIFEGLNFFCFGPKIFCVVFELCQTCYYQRFFYSENRQKWIFFW